MLRGVHTSDPGVSCTTTTLVAVSEALHEELVSPTDIAERLGLRSHRTVLEWRVHLHGFPSPVTRRRTYLWRWSDVERWWRARSAQPGPPHLAVVEPRVMTTSHGWTAPGFEGVREAFEANFTHHNEVGAAFSAYHRGHKVADLWGGIADPATGAAWAEDTMALVFSTTKGVTAMCAHRLADEGLLDVEAPVREYWPEFAANGKADITVAQLLAHQAGLPWVDARLSLDEALAWEPVVHALEAQPPVWEPGTKHGYHATTYGWLVGEVVRRVSGHSLGMYLREAITEPLGADDAAKSKASGAFVPQTAPHTIADGLDRVAEDVKADGDIADTGGGKGGGGITQGSPRDQMLAPT